VCVCVCVCVAQTGDRKNGYKIVDGKSQSMGPLGRNRNSLYGTATLNVGLSYENRFGLELNSNNLARGWHRDELL
jgi:hypothetical protein